MARLTSLHIYPIKSCRGIALDAALLTSRGLAHDREWMVVHADGPQAGLFVSQRTHPSLAWVVPRLQDDVLEVHLDHAPLRDADVVTPANAAGTQPAPASSVWREAVMALCGTPLRLPFTFDPANSTGFTAANGAGAAAPTSMRPAASRATAAPSCAPVGTAAPANAAGAAQAVRVWGDTFPARDAGDEAARWFSTLLDCPVRLVRFDPAVTRLASARWTDGIDAPTTFADGFPILVVNQASLDDLNARLARKGAPPVPMDRFRANIVLDDLDAYEEDYVSALTLMAQDPGQALETPSHDDGTDAQSAARDSLAVHEVPEIALRLVKPCSRCPIPTFDQRSGRPDVAWPHEPLDTLTTYRMDPRVDGVTFGVNAIITAGVGQVLQRGMRAETPLDFGD